MQRFFPPRQFGKIGAWILFPILGTLFVFPLVMLVVGIFRTKPFGRGAEWSVKAFDVLGEPAVANAFATSLTLALSSTIFGLLIASIFAYLSERTDAPFREWIMPSMLVMFATPSIYYALGFSLLANPYTGLINDLARTLSGDAAPFINIESWTGVIAVLSFRTVAFVYLLMVAAFRAIDPAHEDASRVCGVGKIGTFFRIDLPFLMPALSGAALFAIIVGLQAFDTPLILGQPAGITPIASYIYVTIDRQFPPQYAQAGLLGVVLVLVAGLLAGLQHKLLGRRSFVSIGGKGLRPGGTQLGRWRWLAATFILTYLILVQVLPLATLIFSAFQPYPGVYGALTLQHFAKVLSSPHTIDAITTTILLATVVGLGSMALALVIALVSRTLTRGWGSILRAFVLVPFAMPGIVTAVALVSAYASLPGLRALYGTVWLMGIGLLVVVMPFALHQAQTALSQLAPELHDAARIAGVSRFKAFVDIVLPLILPHMLMGWFVAAISVSGTLDIPLLLGSTKVTTVAAEVFDLSSQGKVAQAAALLITLVGGLSLLGLAGLFARKFVRRQHSSGFSKAASESSAPFQSTAAPAMQGSI